ncbi:MAG: hypothetical protein HYX63_18590 [Gammaproteobacteria bacterium]|nr:hypothetical protein [Gammaproteobacteria bacterium]
MTAEQNRSVFVPLALGLLAMVIWSGFQTSQLARERDNLKQTHLGQETPLQTAFKMRAQLDAIASGTAKLAAKGNSNANSIVQALAERGVTINSDDAKTPTPPQ